MVTTDNDKPPISNVVWKSLALQPKASISWVVEYGLNWTLTLPTDGISVTVGGDWQVCNKGESFDLDSIGEWSRSTSPGQPDWLTVGKINYSYPDADGIHIVVGVKNGDNFDCIFVDPTALPHGSSGSYQPQEQVKWWLQASNLQGSVYSKCHLQQTDKGKHKEQKLLPRLANKSLFGHRPDQGRNRWRGP